MKWMGVNELREAYLSFFESKGHKRLPSFSLVPQNDNSLLLINSGMAPMKKFFTGEITPPSKRVTTCQKCIRTPDIERVGITARHGTFFNMLGNFSFGDYFKKDATAWAWEFFTQVLEIPKELLYVSVYEEDDETYDIWTKNLGVEPSHMVRLGKEDNFWEHGSGPCGPCSEIYFDRGAEKGCGKPDCMVGCECDRYVEVWNLVFTQFDSDGKGNYVPLEHPNIDTGMGLERLACVMQGVDNLFLIDTVKKITDEVSNITGVPYGKGTKSDISLRVITDHIRSTTFMISDGVLPSNEGRGYVLRRLLRRGARHGRMLGVTEPFLYKVAEVVIDANKAAYPELSEKHDFIIKLIRVEEENFARTIEQGLATLQKYIEDDSVKCLSGESAFHLNDTLGFPIDLTKEILQENNMTVDEDRFKELLSEQKKRARNSRKNAGADAWISDNVDLTDAGSTCFTGYNDTSSSSKVLAIIKDGERSTAAVTGDKIGIVTDITPFYAESGGQIGDTGVMENSTAKILITNTKKDHTGTVIIHSAVVTEGVLAVGDTVKATIDVERRHDIMRNHTAAHLLQAALRKVLGNHVEQAGQLVDNEKLRFDFTHFSAMTAQELIETEDMVNAEILKSETVTTDEMPIEEAKKLGAMALFGEKYGNVVRVVKAGDFSMEFCGGTHMGNTSQLGLFKIMYEGSVASGVRRIEAVTGRNLVNGYNNCMNIIGESAEILKINNPREMVEGSKQTAEHIKQQDAEIANLKNKLAYVEVCDMYRNSCLKEDIRIMTKILKNSSPEILRAMCEQMIEKEPRCVMVVAGINGDKATIACAVGKQVRERGVKAGAVVKAVAQLAGGNGGGKPDIAMAGARQPDKLQNALEQVEKIVFDQVQ